MPLPFQRRGGAQLRPTFSRDFAGLKTLDHGTGPAITFTRASNATFFNASGVLQTASNDQPRFDHSSTGSSLGLLIEESRTNLLLRSEEFDNAYWVKQDVTITANSAASPNGETIADTLVENSGAVTGPRVYRDINVSTAGAFALSCFAKAAGRDRLRLMFSGGVGAAWSSNRIANFLLSGSGSVSSTSGTGVTATIASVGSGWYRCSLSATTDSTGNSRNSIYVLDGTGSESYTGDGTSGLYIWGAQLEAGAFPTSYIPTTTAAATRSADSAVVTPISSFYNQSEGTLFADASFNAPNSYTTSQLAAEFNNTDDNRFRIGRLQPNAFPVLTNTVATVIDANIAGSSAIAQFLAVKIIGAYKVNDFALYANGSSIGTDTSATPITATHFRIGSGTTFNGFIANGHIRKIAYWPKRLSNTLLQQLTT